MKGLSKASDWLLKKIARESEDGIAWAGWIRGRLNQKRRLRELGVRGLMQWSLSGDPPTGIFEHCSCDTATMERLRKEWSLFWPNAFTGVIADGSQLPYEEQEYWKIRGA